MHKIIFYYPEETNKKVTDFLRISSKDKISHGPKWEKKKYIDKSYIIKEKKNIIKVFLKSKMKRDQRELHLKK